MWLHQNLKLILDQKYYMHNTTYKKNNTYKKSYF